MIRAIYDTNVFVGAGFNPKSASARLLEAARDGSVAMIWHADTRAETQRILVKIPRLSFARVEALFRPAHEYTDPLDLGAVDYVEDPEDRKYAALSLQAGVVLVSSDDDLLSHSHRLDVLKPGPFLQQHMGQMAP